LQITKYGGGGIKGGILFTTASSCELCSKKAYQLGIKEIVYVVPYPGIAQNQIINSGNKRPTIKLFSGAVGRTYHKLYSPILPYKDELEILMTNL
jgi:deoxycytidylate deaminase